jgi:NADPH:quinone reductase-like Zn-dependent oxidoreductase
MRAIQFNQYGGPEVLEWAQAPELHATENTVTISVRAASLNAIDWKIRRGLMSGQGPDNFPAFLGFDAAGVVDQVGEGVTGFEVGDEVFGLGHRTHAEYAVLKSFVDKPAEVSWSEAAAAGVAGETSVRALNLLGVTHGTTVVIDGAAGGVGAVAVQVAVARGATVIATASERNHEYLAALGAAPVQYGDGVTDRIRQVAPGGVDAVLDVVGKTPMENLVSLVDDPQQVVSIANFSAPEHGARVTGGGGDPTAALREIADLLANGRLKIEVAAYPMNEATEAHRLQEQGHVRGKLVLVL